MYRLIVLISFLFFSTLLPADEISDKCGSHPDLYRDTSGNPIWLTSEQLQQRATSQVKPSPVKMAQLNFQGSVSMKVMIGKTGRMICMWGVAGHPIMIPNAVRAAHEWVFKPIQSNGKPVEYLGKLSLHVTTTN